MSTFNNSSKALGASLRSAGTFRRNSSHQVETRRANAKAVSDMINAHCARFEATPTTGPSA